MARGGAGAIICAGVLVGAGAAGASPHKVESGAGRVPLIELYTSEGCSSCPAADEWLSALPRRGAGPERVVTLALHVDYWDQIGWPDPFAQASFSERQRRAAERTASRSVYTPELMLDGRELARGALDEALIREAARPPGARLQLEAELRGAALHLAARAEAAEPRPSARLYLAVYESGLTSRVTAGENRGRTLRHDTVVRRLIGPLPLGEAVREVPIDARWRAAALGVAAFVQDEVTGEVLQALALPSLGL
jgi:hypothetical protein